MPSRPIEPILLHLTMHLDDLTDDELSALADAIKAEQHRRFRLRCTPSVAEGDRFGRDGQALLSTVERLRGDEP